jgi:hypothetical protein
MKYKSLKIVFLAIFSIFFAQGETPAQVFSGFSAYRKLIEYEGQRYLMDDVYQIQSENYDHLKIKKLDEEIDLNEGFMFVLTSYVFNDKSGVVITSLNGVNFGLSKYNFVDVHLTSEEFENLNKVFQELGVPKLEREEHNLRRFNDRLIVDVKNEGGTIFYNLWVDTNNKHSFVIGDWERAVRLHRKFTE